FQVPCSGMLSSPFDLLPCRKGNLKILLSKARKARMSDKDTSCLPRFAQKDFKITFATWK
ncbi:hypothetical protein, partial [Bacteroides fragilis]|uniref:hypothetical protein n=1 Tax=Bacteroides fragilis TaxID=817 RepID=UPI001FBA3263